MAVMIAACAGRAELAPADLPAASAPYERDAVLSEAESFFGRGARGLADVVNRVINDKGPPAAYIKGQEGGGAAGIGLRFGHGTLYLPDGTTADVYWRGPSIGVDFGGNAAKAFVLVYDLPNVDAIYDRFSGVEGSLYYVGGVGVTYNRSGTTVLAPVRFGVGWRQGINVGYLRLSPQRSWRPF
jgi:hypothetical protein